MAGAGRPGDPNVAARLNPPQSIVEIGYRPASEIPQYLGVADVLVQPGRSDTFNAYRFPCKLPMFLASGRPVVLPNCNIGDHLRDGEHCLITHTGSAEEIAEKVSRLIVDPALRRRLGDSGRDFASANLRWDVAADRLLQFYRQTLTAASHARS
jgi:glycosyltransferase involved in cell wall biosynthesis